MGESNWAGNIRYSSSDVVRPASVSELQQLVASASRVHALGTRHSFSTIADTTGTLVDMTGLPRTIALSDDGTTVAVSGGTRYGDLAEWLHERGRALPNLASLPHISVAGAIATGTHGSGDRVGSLAANVRGVELIDGSGELVDVRAGDPEFEGHVVALGALGLVTSVTLATEPAFDVAQAVYPGLPWSTALEHFDALTASGYSVSLFTDWLGDSVGQVWVKTRGSLPDELFGVLPATETMHMLPGSDPKNVTQQLGVAGPWFERLPHFRMGFLPSSGAEIQSEYLLPRIHAIEAIEAVRGLGPKLSDVLQISEIRTMTGDTLWLSPAYDTDRLGGTVALHFTWRLDDSGVQAVLPLVESALAPFSARPHWGKLFLDRDRLLPGLYPELGSFRDLAARRDPRGVFRNDFLDEHVFGGS